MENRFGFKELVIAFLLAALIVLVIAAMVQYDRQYQDVRQIKSTLGDIKTLLANGAAASGGAQPSDAGQKLDPSSPFYRIQRAREEPNFAMGGWLINAFGGGVAKLTPLLSGDVSAATVQGHVLDTLATRNPETLDWQGLLATSWQTHDNSKAWRDYVKGLQSQGISRKLLTSAIQPAKTDEQWAAFKKAMLKQAKKHPDPDNPLTAELLARLREAVRKMPDALTIDFKLRRGVTFSDGQPLTADDVVFTYNFTMNPAINAPRDRAYLRRIRSVEKKGAHEVVFHYGEPYFHAFEMAASTAVLPKHFYSQFTPRQFNQSVGYLMGSGPYMLENPKSWKPGDLIQLVRNPHYWGMKPAFNRLIYKEITNDVARMTAFRNGDVDVFSGPSPRQYDAMTANADVMARSRNFDFFSAIGGYRYIAWNEVSEGHPGRFADRRVRQAMTMLIDRKRMIQEVMLGYAKLATGPFNPRSKQYDKSVKPWPFDVSRAKALLADAGYRDRDGDGVIEGPDGRPFRFRLTYPSGHANYEKMVLFLKDSYARAGIVLKPNPLEWSVFTQRLKNKNFEAITLAWSAGIETDIYQMFDSSQMVKGGDDFISYRNPKLDQVVEKARGTVQEDQRMPLWHKAHRILHRDQPYTFLFFPDSLSFMTNRIANIKKVKLGLNPSDEWYVPAKKQKYGR